MAKVEINSPSENEDFDVKADEASAAEDTSTDTSTTDLDSISPEEPATAEVAEEDTAPAEAEAEPEAPAEPEATEEPTPVEEPVVAAPVPVDKPKGKGASVGRIIFEAVLVIAVIGLGLYAWSLSSDKSNLESQLAQAQSNPQAIIQKQADDLIIRVSKLLELPKGEEPTVASVDDAAAAKAQSPFFTNAQNGDKVLIYVKAGEAILYRPSTNKIILVAPLTFDSAAATTKAKQ
ncbi:MAG: hypothetical protein AAB462_04120 [Patescibacteria group bacterium]